MSQNNALLRGAGNLVTMVSAMVATSRRGIELVAEQPAVEREGIKSINYKLAAGLVAAGLGCGTEINNYYGPNGEEITNSGNCGEFKGKHIHYAGECNAGTVEPVGRDCSITFSDGNIPERKYVGFVAGRIIHLQGGELNGRPYGPSTRELFRHGEFTIDDLDVSGYEPESQRYMAEQFMCYFTVDPDLLAVRFNAKPKIKASVANIFRQTDRPFSRRDCDANDRENGQWYKQCSRR